MPVNFTFGGEPVEVLIGGFAKDLDVQPADLLYALNKQKTRILTRTAQGLDVNGNQFHPYSEKGPYYYYPGKGAKNRKAAAGRAHKKIGGGRTTLGVKFKSYGDFKRSLGRSVVDLIGASAPHMLQAIVVKVGAYREGTIGIYGPEADRAEGHNIGAGHLPKREFFGISPSDETQIANDIEDMIGRRMKRMLQ